YMYIAGKHALNKYITYTQMNNLRPMACIRLGLSSYFLLAVLSVLSAQSDTISATINHDGEYLVREVFLSGECFEVFNIQLSGEVGQAGTFTDGMASIGLESGIILSNGNVSDISGPNQASDTSTDYGRPGNDPDLELLSQLEGDASNLGQADVVVLEFDFIPTVTNASFDFVFASEEYCEFALSTFYDTFGFFVSGPGINGPFTNNAMNVAIVPGTNSPITARNVNFFNNSAYYVNNTPASFGQNCTLGVPAAHPDLIAFDGYTVPLKAEFTVQACQTYHLKLVVADRSSDASWDSAVFLGASSFAAGLTSNITSTVRGPSTSGNDGIEGCGEAVLIFSRGDSVITNDLVVHYDILATSTATEGVDFSEIPDSIIIPAGVYEDTVTVQLFADNVPEGDEFFTIKLDNPCKCSRGELSFSIIEPPPLTANISGRQEICLSEAIELAVTPTSGNGLISYLWENGDTDSLYNVAPTTTRLHRVTLTDECGQEEVIETEVIVHAPSATLSGEVTICEGRPADSLTVRLQGAQVYSFDLVGTNETISFSSITADSLRLPVSQTSVYELRNLSGNGCPGQVQGIGSAVVIDIDFEVAVDTVDCFGGNDGSIFLRPFGGDGTYTYSWAHDAGLNSATATGLDAGAYFARASDSRGCQDTITVVVPEPNELLLDVDTIRGSEDCRLGGSLSVSVSGGTEPFTVTWSNGETSAVIEDLAAGNYAVSVSDSKGCQATAAAAIADRTTPPPAPIIAPVAALDCDQASVDIDARSSDPSPQYRYHWINENGDSLTVADPLFWSSSEPGIYTLVVTNTLTGCQATASTEVQENTDTLTVRIVAPDPSINCGNASVSLSAIETNGKPVNWQWSSPTGLIDGDPNTAQVRALAAGWYYLRGEVPGSNCFSLDSILVEVDTLRPDLQLAGTEVLDCLRPTASLSVTPLNTGTFTYQWQTDGTLTGDPNTSAVIATAAGTYAVTVTNTDNHCEQSAQFVVTDNRSPVEVAAIPDQILNCNSPTIDLRAQANGNGNFDFYWLAANGDTLARTATYTVAAAGQVRVLAVNPNNGCFDTTDFRVQLDTLPPQALIPTPDTLTCLVEEVELTNAVIAMDWEAQWEDEGGNLISSGNWIQNVTTEGVYTLIVSNTRNGCRDTAQTQVLLLDNPPIATLNVPDTLDCSIQQLDLSARVAEPGDYTYIWSGPTNGFLGPTDRATVTATRPGNYSVEITNQATGCSASYSLTVIERNTDLLIDPIADTSLTCLRTQLELVANSPTPGDISYRWLDAQGTQIGASASITIRLPGNYELEMTNNDTGCRRTLGFLVEDDTEQPAVSAQAIQPLTCEQTTSTLSALAGPPNWQPYWLNSNGDTLARDQWSFTANEADTYQLLVVDTNNGCRSIVAFDLPADTIAPLASLLAPPALDCRQPQIRIQSQVTGGSGSYVYQWTGPAGGILGEDDTAQVTVGLSGDYTLVLTDQANGCRDTLNTTVADNSNPPQLSLPADTVLDCSTTSISLLASSSTSANLSYQWTDEQGNIISQTPELRVTAAGIYTLELINTDNGCMTTGSLEVADNTTPPMVEAGDPVTLGCNAEDVTIQAEVGPGTYQIRWLNNLGIELSAGSSQLTTDEPGLYTLEVTNPANNCVGTDTVRVLRDQNLPHIQVTDSQLDCFSNTASVNLSGTATGSQISYAVFDANGELLTSSREPELSVMAPGTYELVVTDSSNACANSATFQVTADYPLIEDLLVSSPECVGERGLLEVRAVSGGTSPYLYGLNEGEFSPVSAFGDLEAGTYHVVVQDANGCEDRQEVVLIPPSPIDIVLDDQIELKLGESRQLQAQVNRTPSEISRIQWQPAELLSCSDCLNPSVLATNSTNFAVTITDTNGCMGVARTTVLIDETVPVYIPNAFSPNQDGTNDSWVIFGDPAQISQLLDLAVYDRWGNQVFYQDQLTLNSDNLAWDGTLNGQVLNAGVYVYQLRLQLLNGEVVSYEGEVLLLY
ncbi:MAG: hypothetical protein D6772_12635, partial [Bacteroidetes bacterium]